MLKSVHVLFTSRTEVDITNTLRFSIRLLNVPMDLTQNREDIRQYLPSQFESSNALKTLNEASGLKVQEVLLNRSEGMFSWVYCQLGWLKELKLVRLKDIEGVIKLLQATLDNLYYKVLAAINQRYSPEVSRALRWLAYSLHPLRTEEVNEACIIDPEAELAMNEDNRLLPGGICLLLFTLVTEYLTNNGRQELCLVHVTIKGFLVSKGIQQSMYSVYGFQETSAHAFLAKSCIKCNFYYSSSRKKTSTSADLEIFPLLRYTCSSWYEHLRLARGKNHISLDRLAIQLLRSNATWTDSQHIHNPISHRTSPFDNIIIIRLSSTLCWASHLGIDSVAELLLDEGEDIDARENDPSRFCDTLTALDLAALEGHESTTRLLLRRGADVDKHYEDYGSALHGAVEVEDTKIIKLLLDHNANPDLYGRCGTALELAAKRGNLEICKLLLMHGADPDIGCGEHENALASATYMEEDAIAALLLDSGGEPKRRGWRFELRTLSGFRGWDEWARGTTQKDCYFSNPSGRKCQFRRRLRHAPYVSTAQWMGRRYEVNAGEGCYRERNWRE